MKPDFPILANDALKIITLGVDPSTLRAGIRQLVFYVNYSAMFGLPPSINEKFRQENADTPMSERLATLADFAAWIEADMPKCWPDHDWGLDFTCTVCGEKFDPNEIVSEPLPVSHGLPPGYVVRFDPGEGDDRIVYEAPSEDAT